MLNQPGQQPSHHLQVILAVGDKLEQILNLSFFIGNEMKAPPRPNITPIKTR